MEIIFLNVDENNVHDTKGPDVRFTLVNKGKAAVRAFLTIDTNIHIAYPSKAPKGTNSNRTLEKGLHAASMVIVAAEADGNRDYEFSIAVNGKVVARTVGSIPAGATSETALDLFQLRVN